MKSRQKRMKKTVASMVIMGMLACGVMNGYSTNVVKSSTKKQETTDVEGTKDEVIYANLNYDGVQDKVYAVNSFTGSKIEDYGEYTAVKNMNTLDTLNYDKGKVYGTNSTDKLYYEGTMKQETELPWKIAIEYWLNGKKVTAEQLAGRQGTLKLTIAVRENTKAKKEYFKHYALQAVIKLDSETCQKIKATGATIANVGNDTQLSYSILPGKSKDIEVCTEVSNFEMEGIAFNGIRMDLGVNIDSMDTSNMTDMAKELRDAVSTVHDGSDTLKKNTNTLRKGADTLSNGAEDIKKGISKLQKKGTQLNKGSKNVSQGLKKVDNALKKVTIQTNQLEKLVSASTEIKNGLDTLVGGMNSMKTSIDSYYQTLQKSKLSSAANLISQNTKAIQSLGITDTQRKLYQAYTVSGTAGVQKCMAELVASADQEAVALYKKVQTIGTDALTEYITNAGKLVQIEQLLQADNAYVKGSDALIQGIGNALDAENGSLMTGATQLQSGYEEFHKNIQSLVTSLQKLSREMTTLKKGIHTLTKGCNKLDKGVGSYTNAVNTLKKGYGELYQGIVSLSDGSSRLYRGTCRLAAGTKTLDGKTISLPEKIDDKINDVFDELTGGDYHVTSFTSPKNKKIGHVQFVLKSQKIAVPEKAAKTTVNTNEKNVFEKFIALFQ